MQDQPDKTFKDKIIRGGVRLYPPMSGGCFLCVGVPKHKLVCLHRNSKKRREVMDDLYNERGQK